jgi:ribosome-binding factor A
MLSFLTFYPLDFRGTWTVLEHAKNFLRRELSIRLGLFRVPELHFEADVATELGGRMDHLLKRIQKGRLRE